LRADLRNWLFVSCFFYFSFFSVVLLWTAPYPLPDVETPFLPLLESDGRHFSRRQHAVEEQKERPSSELPPSKVPFFHNSCTPAWYPRMTLPLELAETVAAEVIGIPFSHAVLGVPQIPDFVYVSNRS